MEDGVAWKGPGGKQFQRGTRTPVVVMDKFTLEIVSQRVCMCPNTKVHTKNNQRRFYV